jgi:hypothetical protein
MVSACPHNPRLSGGSAVQCTLVEGWHKSGNFMTFCRTKYCLLYPAVWRIWLYQPSSSVQCNGVSLLTLSDGTCRQYPADTILRHLPTLSCRHYPTAPTDTILWHLPTLFCRHYPADNILPTPSCGTCPRIRSPRWAEARPEAAQIRLLSPLLDYLCQLKGADWQTGRLADWQTGGLTGDLASFHACC